MKQKQVQAFMQNLGNFTQACHCKYHLASDPIIHERKQILTMKASLSQDSVVFILESHLYPNAAVAAAAAADSKGC